MGFITGDETPNKSAADVKPVVDQQNRRVERQQSGGKTHPAQSMPPIARKAHDMTQVALNSFSFGAPWWMHTGAKTIENMLQGEEHPFESARQEVFQPLWDAQDRLSGGEEMFASMLGAIPQTSGPGMLDDLFGLSMRKSISPNEVTRLGLKPLRFATAGGVDGMLSSYAEGNLSFEDALERGAIGFVAAPIMQAVIGDVAAPFVERRLRANGLITDYGGAIDSIRDLPLNPKGYTIQNLLDGADALPPGKSIFDIEVPSPHHGKQEGPRRFYNAMAKLHFGNVDDTKVGLDTPWFKSRQKSYEETLAAVTRYAEETNEAARKAVFEALGSPGGREAAIASSSPQLQAANAMFARISDQSEGALGAQELNAREIAAELTKRVAEGFRAKDGDIRRAPEEAQWVLNQILNMMKTEEVNPAALTVRNVVSEGVKRLEQNDIDAYKRLNVAELFGNRKTFASKVLAPGAIIDGNSIDKTKRKAAMEILSMLDEVIANNTQGLHGEAREMFKDAMQRSEAFDLGREMYRHRSGELADDVRFVQSYGETVEDFLDNPKYSDQVKDMFRQGFKQGMFDTVGSRGFLTEMRYFVGEYDSTPGAATFFKHNEQGLRLMKRILGEEDTAIVLNVLDEGKETAEYTSRLVDLISSKGGNPKPREVDQLIGDAAPLLHSTYREKINNGWDATAAFLDYILKPGDRQKVRALENLIRSESPELVKLMERGARQSLGLPMSLGTRASHIALEGLDEEHESVQKAEIEQYFESLGIKP